MALRHPLSAAVCALPVFRDIPAIDVIRGTAAACPAVFPRGLDWR